MDYPYDRLACKILFMLTSYASISNADFNQFCTPLLVIFFLAAVSAFSLYSSDGHDFNLSITDKFISHNAGEEKNHLYGSLELV